MVVDDLRRLANDGVQRPHLLHEQVTEPDFDVAGTSNWLLQLTVTEQFKHTHTHTLDRVLYLIGNKSSAVAEMGDRVRAKWAEKCGGCCAPFRGELGPHL